MTKDDKQANDLRTYHHHPVSGVTVTITPIGVVVEHSAAVAPEFSVSVRTSGMIVSQRGGDDTTSMVLAKGRGR